MYETNALIHLAGSVVGQFPDVFINFFQVCFIWRIGRKAGSDHQQADTGSRWTVSGSKT